MGTIGLTRQQFVSLSHYVASTFNCKLISQKHHTQHGCYSYTHRCHSPINGIKLLYLKGHGVNYRASIIIPGKALRTLHFHDILAFMTRLTHVFRVKFTRIDLCMDDYRRRVSYKFLHSLAIQGETAGAQLYDGRRSGVCGDKGLSGSDSIYFGSKRRILNIYNAEFMHGIPADRWEARFREDYCLDVCNYLTNNFDGDANPYTEESDNNIQHLLTYCAHKVLGIVKFIHRKGKAKNQSVKTYKRYAFYDSFFKEIDEIDPRALRNSPTPDLNSYQFVVRSFDWLNRQVFKRLVTLKKSFGSELFSIVLSACYANAYENFTEADHVRLEDTTKFMKKVKSDYLQQFLAQLA